MRAAKALEIHMTEPRKSDAPVKGAAELRAVATLMKAAKPTDDDSHSLALQAFQNILEQVVIPILDEPHKEAVLGVVNLLNGVWEDPDIADETLPRLGKLFDCLAGDMPIARTVGVDSQDASAVRAKRSK
jgi:hypothetical protein